MTKTIINIIQNDSGGTNPDTHAHEDKVWELQFEDEDSAVLTKGKMLEYLTKGTVPVKTVHSFKKWDIITTLGHTIRTWVVVYDDKSHVQLANKDFYSLLTHGHTTVNGEVTTSSINGQSGNLQIMGWPFTVSSTAGNYSGGPVIYASGLAITSGTALSWRVDTDGTGYIHNFDEADGGSAMSAAEWSDNGTMRFSGTFWV